MCEILASTIVLHTKYSRLIMLDDYLYPILNLKNVIQYVENG